VLGEILILYIRDNVGDTLFYFLKISFKVPLDDLFLCNISIEGAQGIFLQLIGGENLDIAAPFDLECLKIIRNLVAWIALDLGHEFEKDILLNGFVFFTRMIHMKQ